MIVPAPFGQEPEQWYPWAQSLVDWLDKKFGIGGSPRVGGVQGITGEVRTWSGATAPDGWGACEGQVLKRADNAGLFKVWGTRWNTGGEAGDEFRAPDARGKAILGFNGSVYGGSDTVTLIKENLPLVALSVDDEGHSHPVEIDPHTHTVNDPGHVHSVGSALAGGSAITVGGGATSVNLGANTTLSAGSSITGVTVNSTTATGATTAEMTGISVTLNGSSQPIPITPSFIGFLVIFKF